MHTHSRFLVIATVACMFQSEPVSAQEYWGKFEDSLEGVFTNTPPRPHFVLSKKFGFLDPNGLRWMVPAGAKVDGASIPQAFWSVIGGPFEGAYLNASVIHDYYCEIKTRTAHDTHRNFYYGMLANGVPKWKAKTMHWAVSTFGPDWRLLPRAISQMSCNSAGSHCASFVKLEMKLEVSTAPNLEDPEILALALGKLAATAKTLKTSNGEVLDVGSMGQVDASLDSLEANSAAYRKLLSSGDLNSRINELGILADPNSANLDKITVWENNKIPAANELKSYRLHLAAGKTDAGFVVESGDIDALERGLDFKALVADIDVGGPS